MVRILEPEYSQILTAYRFSIRRHALHWIYANTEWTESPRI
jgi:hypothetical protein